MKFNDNKIRFGAIQYFNAMGKTKSDHEIRFEFIDNETKIVAMRDNKNLEIKVTDELLFILTKDIDRDSPIDRNALDNYFRILKFCLKPELEYFFIILGENQK